MAGFFSPMCTFLAYFVIKEVLGYGLVFVMPHGRDDAGVTSRGLFITAALPPSLTKSSPLDKDT